MSPNRREFLLAGAAASIAVRADSFEGPLGLELYTFRTQMKKDIPGTLANIRRLGFHEVEVFDLHGLSSGDFRSALDRAGLRATSFLVEHDRLSGDRNGVERDARTLGASWVVLPWIPHNGAFTPGDAQTAAKEMNNWSSDLAASGLRFAYHAHGYEFGGSAQGTLFDTLAAETDPAKVFFEMDTFWIAVPGQDCVKLLERYPSRFRLMHVKDLRKGAPTGSLTGQARDEDSVAVGSGALAWPSILRAAKKAGVERYYIEDESPAAETQVPDSIAYLRTIDF
jgi:sugar phosphate isomerase/epimerase